MAGGTFLVQDKVRPGAYINIKGVANTQTKTGSRGIVTIPMPLDWGETGKIIKIDSMSFMQGKHLKELGYFGHEEEMQVIREALKHSHTLLLYRLDTGATKSTVTIGSLTATAKYPGILGNKLSIAVKALTESTYEVITVLGNKSIDKQIVSEIDELQNNEFVVFTGTGELTANAGKALEGATPGNVDAENYELYFKAIKIKQFNTMGVYTTDNSVKQKVVQFIQSLRDTKGKKVQVVLNDYLTSNTEAVISINQGYKTESETIDIKGFVGYIAGLTAGTDINKSNTGHVITGATEIVNYIDDDLIDDELKKGNLVLSYTSDERVQIEQDINTLIVPGVDKTKAFSKNRVIRCLDDIANHMALIWEQTYKGKVDNEDAGRDTLKADILGYLRTLEQLKAITNVNAEDVIVSKGNDIDSVSVEVNVQPVDSMEKLYMNVNVY